MGAPFRKLRYSEYVGDFETSVYKGQTSTEVWATALVALDSPDDPEYVTVNNSLSKFIKLVESKARNNHLRIYFHNLKFDGSFIMGYLLRHPEKYKLWGTTSLEGIKLENEFVSKLPEGHFTYSVSDKGLWYHITYKINGHLVQFVDSLKLLPFSVREIGKAFKTKHNKLEMEYEGERHENGIITDEEEDYIKNDVLVVKEALNFMHSQGHTELTIGSCCLKEFKSYYDKEGWEFFFPDLYDTAVAPNPPEGFETWGEYIRRSYHGGWCYVVPEKAEREYYNGTTADVNSLYPSMMHSDSGNRYPVGLPHYFKGDVPEEIKNDPEKYYFIRVKTRFKIKKNMLPTVQIKNMAIMYNPREWLTTSDHKDRKGIYRDHVMLCDERIECRPELVLTMTDWEMMQEHYELYDTEIIDGCYFDTVIGLFDDYINKYAEIKMNSKGAMRTLAKLFLNNLYGKFATSTDSSYNAYFLGEDNILRSYSMKANDKQPGYIPIGSAITSYARHFTITAAQKNYHGIDKPGFIYADTDSIHCDLSPDEIIGAPEHPFKFNHWKYEAQWNYGKFIRAKTYVEHVTGEDRKPVEPYYNLKCAGMPDHAKDLFIKSVARDYRHLSSLDVDEIAFVLKEHTWENFKAGLEVPGVLKARSIPGGTLLVKQTYKMRDKI